MGRQKKTVKRAPVPAVIKSSPTFPKTLITGAAGMVGSYLEFGFKTDHATLDVTNLDKVLAVCRDYQPEVIIHLAAVTNVEACEKDPAMAYLINSVGTYNMGLAAKEVGAKLIYVSTDAVFDGRKGASYDETDVPNPTTYYSRSKYLGELAVAGMLKNYLIVRTAWVFGGGPTKDKKFVAKIIKQFKAGEISVVTDQIGSPTFAKDLATALVKLIKGNEQGIVHLTNRGSCSRYEMAEAIVKILKPGLKVIATHSRTYDPDLPPANFSLHSRLAPMRPWQDALTEYLNDEWKPVIL